MEKEIEIARKSILFALDHGADKVRVTLSKSLMNLLGILNGEIDKVASALDRSLSLSLFVDGRFGSFSTNKLEEEGLERFILQAIDTVRMLAEDRFRVLPAPDRKITDARKGTELDLYDPAYPTIGTERRLELSLGSSIWSRKAEWEKGFTLISEEGEYSDSIFDSVVMDSEGLFARHTETSFEIGYEATVETPSGERFSAYWWDAAPRLEEVLESIRTCSAKALERAAAQIGPQEHRGGKMNLVIDTECASKVVKPILNALGGYAIQQKNSFLMDRLGEKVFPECLTLLDEPHESGKTGSRLFDSEGVATRPMAIIEKGVIKTYFINSYIAGKLGTDPTVEDCTRPVILPVGGCKTRDDVLAKAGEGILVTGFNGGNSNSTTGDFSFGIEGFYFKDGIILHPVREMLITGNFITLWNNLFAAAEDARPCMSKIIPTLAFSNVDFSG